MPEIHMPKWLRDNKGEAQQTGQNPPIIMDPFVTTRPIDHVPSEPSPPQPKTPNSAPIAESKPTA